MLTVDGRASVDGNPSKLNDYSQLVSPPPRIDTLDGLLSMRESKESIKFADQMPVNSARVDFDLKQARSLKNASVIVQGAQQAPILKR